MLTGWSALLVAGVFEVGFTTALKLEQRDKRYFWLFLLCAAISFFFLERAIQTLPIGTAYAVWTGIGAVGTALVGMLFFGEKATPLRLGLLGTAVLLIAGMRVLP